jgi:type II secretory pathway component PulC
MGTMHMNTSNTFGRLGTIAAVAATLALGTTAALGQEAPPARVDSGRDRTEAQLAEAQARLEAAAREIAELTARIVGDAGIDAVTRIEELVRRARPVMLGITIGPVGQPGAREDGVKVLGVTPGSSAEEAGIRSGDVLVSLGEQRLEWSDEHSPVDKLLEGLREIEPGARVELGYRRDGRTAQATVEARPWSWARALYFDNDRARVPPPPGMPRPGAFMRPLMADRWGDMELVALSPGLGEYFKTDEGVLVVRAPADPTLGLQDGDVIVDIAGRKPLNPAHVVRILRSYAPGERLVMTIVRSGEQLQLEAVN